MPGICRPAGGGAGDGGRSVRDRVARAQGTELSGRVGPRLPYLAGVTARGGDEWGPRRVMALPVPVPVPFLTQPTVSSRSLAEGVRPAPRALASSSAREAGVSSVPVPGSCPVWDVTCSSALSPAEAALGAVAPRAGVGSARRTHAPSGSGAGKIGRRARGKLCARPGRGPHALPRSLSAEQTWPGSHETLLTTWKIVAFTATSVLLALLLVILARMFQTKFKAHFPPRCVRPAAARLGLCVAAVSGREEPLDAGSTGES